MEILLMGSVACIIALISSAWMMTFAKWFPVPGVDALIIDYKTLIRAHIDYALMALFGLAFFGAGIDLPVIACWCVAIGGFTNPTIFTVAAFDTNFWAKTQWKVFSALSFMVTTVGFVWIGYTYIQHAIH